MQENKMKLVKINEDNCVYCHLCEVACKTEHSISKDIIKAVKKENVLSRCTAEFNYPYSASIMCRHCDDAPCIFACQNGSMHRDERGYVVVNQDTCVGCWMCVMVCPYGVIKQGKNNNDWDLSVKCDMCPDRGIPACVEACPNEALTFEEL
jgi:carbon-monoxide dehydrogenase iron sulfur subunit